MNSVTDTSHVIQDNLPSMWNAKDNYSSLSLTHNNLWVSFRGHGKAHQKEAASVRSNNSIPKSCGIYYFEIHIISKGRDGFIGIGLTSRKSVTNRLPGLDKNSYGYHGDDGCIFSSSSSGKPYGPSFTTNDVIGCGLNTITNTCFYTKNGIFLGHAFQNVPSNLYPTIGLQTSGETIAANFGQESFMYDIEGISSSFRQKLIDSIIKRKLPSHTVSTAPDYMHELVLSYLVHHGHCRSARAFASATDQDIAESEASMVQRQQIHNYILSGKISEVIKMCDSFYPDLFESNLELKFRVKCQQFLEILSGNDSINLEAFNGTENIFPYEDSNSIENSNISTARTYKELASLVYFGRNELIPIVNVMLERKLMTEELTSYYQDIFSIFVYPDPMNSPLTYLLDNSQRISLGNYLNSVILMRLNLPANPPLHTLLQYANQTWKYMQEKEVSSTALLSINHFCT
ncbi:Ran-binding protein 10 [Oopsacas minuta]|uniref:Ran-binding protein 10 n=1 Tax=Oopsacas minuta TaxID=111878 RepID=A0AAV7JUS6_9METZ|nr:Ran-binding protein 10 [Oopsacas minuta]